MPPPPLLKRFVGLSLLASGLALAPFLRADSILLKSRETIEGELVGMQAGFVLLRIAKEGQVTRRIDPSAIDALHFSDADTTLEAKVLRRARFLGLLSERDESLLLQLLQRYLDAHSPLQALAYAKLWSPKIQYVSNLDRVRHLTLQAALEADLPGEALAHAQRWVAEAELPAPLAWQVIAQDQLDRGHAEAALWTALHPIAHATAATSEKDLLPLRQIAAAAYRSLGYEKHASAFLTADDAPADHPPTSEAALALPSLNDESLTFTQLLKTQSP